ncbi:GGDEF domain-containing protein [Clostridium luticellarii]|uniref:GGDEF domain-containing protein n=1 Tax=Clostridium luticellarii TaxID=1691940 RepID=UPI0023566CB5|nr:GGDEF domain-containing protein [Clostridium luticellarii]MCI1996728.1 GGDEF domain-containing protein [Clostridium luticellarii]
MDYEDMDRETLIRILREKDTVLEKLYMEREKLNYYASTDVMTGVLNRRSGLKMLNRELILSRIGNKNLVVCFVDVDGLKIVNDNFGHQEGDKLLINTAKILKDSIRKTDFVIRMGGDEFLVIFPGAAMEEVHKIWHRIEEKLKEYNENNENYNFSLSCGFCECRKGMQCGMSVEDLIKNADFEMYKKKLQKKKEL